MAEYIERKKLEEAFDNADPDVCESDLDGHSDWGFGRENVRDVIRGVPAADVVPVVHGMWEYIPQTLNTLSQLRCPFCRWWSFDPSIDGVYNYCPNCGAKMDGDSDES